ncbi:MAG: class I SAM-dependent methyltransferase [bacterium]|nr:class I SAM-dependent methyltransferase [bacterium]
MEQGQQPEPAVTRAPKCAPGSITATSNSGRKTQLALDELVEELDLALTEHGDLDKSPRAARLLGTLVAAHRHRLNVFGNRYSRVTEAALFRMLHSHPDFTPDHLRGGTFVDLGCGGLNPLAGLLVLLGAGASRGIGIDLEPVANEPTAIRALAKTAIELIAEPSFYLGNFPIAGEEVRRNLRRFDIRAVDQARREALADCGLEFRNTSAEATGIEDGTVDGICSASFLEHVPDLDSVLAETARITRRGGLGSHRIDGVDHRSYGQPGIGPLDFLQEESDAPIVFSCNRIRPTEMPAKFEQHGFEVRDFAVLHREPVTAEQRAEFVEPYRSMTLDDLAILGARISVVRR